MHVAVSPAVDPAELSPGREVLLNEAINVVATCGYERIGEVVMVKEMLGDDRVLVVAHADEERVCRMADSLEGTVRVGDALMLEPRSGFVYERIPKAEVSELVLEEVPDIDYEDIGGLSGQIEAIRDAVELPYLHPDLFTEHSSSRPRACCSTARPAAARRSSPRPSRRRWPRRWPRGRASRSASRFFLNIKGPELLNGFVGDHPHRQRSLTLTPTGPTPRSSPAAAPTDADPPPSPPPLSIMMVVQQPR